MVLDGLTATVVVVRAGTVTRGGTFIGGRITYFTGLTTS